MELLFNMTLWSELVKEYFIYITVVIFIVSAITGSIVTDDFEESALATILMYIGWNTLVLLLPIAVWFAMAFTLFAGIYMIVEKVKGK